MEEKMQIRRVQVGMLGTNCYVVSMPNRDDCVVIDPGADAEKIRQAMGEKKLSAVLLTHGHFDHMSAADDLVTAGVQLYIHEQDAAMLQDPALNVSWMIGEQVTVQAAPISVSEGDTIEAAGLTFTVLHTPGHTAGSCCYACGDVLFTGDTVMGMGCGRTDLPTGSEEAMMTSLHRLQKMQGTTTMLGGHG